MTGPRTVEAEAVVLGIDAAWTTHGSTGIAVTSRMAGCWKLTGVWDDYASFHAAAALDGSLHQLSLAALRLTGRRPDLIAVDMPLSHEIIRTRRAADDAVSRLYGARHAGTHSPNELRPGEAGRRLHNAFAADGFPLATRHVRPPCVIEVYPHPALIELTAAEMRLPYKAGKVGKYWPSTSAEERRNRLLDVWEAIIAALDAKIAGVAAALPLPNASVKGAALKSFEDKIDGVVCAWIGIEALEGRAIPHGDESASIWIPASRGREPAVSAAD